MFIYVQRLLIVMLEVLCCKIFFETFGVKRNKNNSWKNHVIIAGLIVLIFFSAMLLYNYFFIKQVLIIIITSISMMIYLKISFLKSFILSALFQGFLLVVDYFALLINTAIFHSMSEIGKPYIVQDSLAIVFGRVFLFFVVLLIRKNMGKDMLVTLVDKEWIRFIFFPIFTICIVAAMIKSIGSTGAWTQENMFLAIVCGLAGINIAVFYLIHDILRREAKIHEDEIFRLKVENQISMYRSISENFSQQKKKIHEYKNQIICIDTLIKKKKFDTLEEFVNRISGQLNKELDCISTNNVIVDAVLNTKYQETKEKNIVFVFKMNDLSNLDITDEDIVIILSNLLNNAIEACEKCKENKVIKLKLVVEGNDIIISVKNTYENAVVYENGEIQTTKEQNPDEHGIGIKNIIETIEKYGGSYIIQNGEHEFYFSIMIPRTKSDTKSDLRM